MTVQAATRHKRGGVYFEDFTPGEVVEHRYTRAGIVEFHHRAYNQDNKLVAECRRQAFMRMRPK